MKESEIVNRVIKKLASTDYMFQSSVPLKKFKAAITSLGYEIEHSAPDDANAESFSITDGTNYLWVYLDGAEVTGFSRYGDNQVDDMIEAIADAVGIDIYSEHDEEFGNLMDLE